MSESAYEERYCAFIDILGFKRLIADIKAGTVRVEDVSNVLRAVRQISQDGVLSRTAGFYEADLRDQSISDGLCLSAKCNDHGLAHLFKAVQILILQLLHRGCFTRGAIVKGLLYHDNTNAFGDALIQAYTLEQTVVRYPRVMITREVALEAKQYEASETHPKEFSRAVEQAADGPYFYHALRALALEGNVDEETRASLLTRFNATADKIQELFDQSVDNPSHFEKVQWFAKYWNSSLQMLKLEDRMKKISGPGLATGVFLF